MVLPAFEIAGYLLDIEPKQIRVGEGIIVDQSMYPVVGHTAHGFLMDGRIHVIGVSADVQRPHTAFIDLLKKRITAYKITPDPGRIYTRINSYLADF